MHMMNPTKESVSSALLSPNLVANLLKISLRFPKILFIFLTLIIILYPTKYYLFPAPLMLT